MFVPDDLVREIEDQISALAPALVLGGSNSQSSEAIVAGLAARYGRDTVLEAIRQIKNH